MLWNILNDDTQKLESVAAFKKEIKTWDGTSSFCAICKWTFVFLSLSINMYFLRSTVNSW